jgi:hypothetical protein
MDPLLLPDSSNQTTLLEFKQTTESWQMLEVLNCGGGKVSGLSLEF